MLCSWLYLENVFSSFLQRCSKTGRNVATYETAHRNLRAKLDWLQQATEALSAVEAAISASAGQWTRHSRILE